MGKLLVKKLDPRAITPVCAHPGEDLGYDLFALEDVFLEPFKQVVVKTGIAAVYVEAPRHIADQYRQLGRASDALLGPSGGWYNNQPRLFGLEVEDRSGMAAKNGIHVLAGKIDAGYRGEIGVVMMLLGKPQHQSEKMFAASVRRLRAEKEHNVQLDVPEHQVHKLAAKWRTGLADYIDNFRLSFGAYPACEELGYQIKSGDKIAQMQPREVFTEEVLEVSELPHGARGEAGYGSTGR